MEYWRPTLFLRDTEAGANVCVSVSRVCPPFSLKVLGSNLILEDLELALSLSPVQLCQPQGLIQLQRFTAQRHNLVHLQVPHCSGWSKPLAESWSIVVITRKEKKTLRR